MTRTGAVGQRERRGAAARWGTLALLAAGALALAPGCGKSDAPAVSEPAAGGSGAAAGTAGTAGQPVVDASAGGGNAGHAGTQDASEAKAGSAGAPTDGGGGADVSKPDGGGSDGAAGDAATACKADPDCANNPAGHYCDAKTGKCVECKPSAPSSCQLGQYCDPATFKCAIGCDTPEDCDTGMDAGPVTCDDLTHKCVNCTTDNQCPLGSVCKSNACEPGCTPQHGCQGGQTCCSSKCADTKTDPANCDTCGNACSYPNAIPMCVAGACVVDACQPGWADCDKKVANGCETPAGDGGAGCACQPGAVQDCYGGPTGTENVGVCKGGKTTCNAAGTAWGPCVGQVLPSSESCFTAGDDDCDGQVNEDGAGCVCKPNVTEACYSGPPATRNVGICKDGAWTCNALGTAWGNCDGQVLPAAETCLTPVDDDCDGEVNEVGGAGCSCTPGSTAACYGGPPGTQNVGVCKAGLQTCDAMGTGYGPCSGDVVPSPDVCTDNLDNDCNGVTNDGIGAGATGCVCFPGAMASCYTGPANTKNVGECKAGIATCSADGAAWGSCAGQVTPSTDHCTDALDNDCNGVANDGYGKGGQGCVCTPGAQLDCYDGPPGTLNVGVCVGGKKTCAADGKSWSACLGQVIPDLDSCLDGLDNDCNGIVNDGNHLAPGCACVPGSIKCVNNHEVTCNAQGDWGPPGGLCNQICKAGQYHCDCNQVMQCDVGPPAKWVPRSPAVLCNAANGQACVEGTGTCQTLGITGSATPTGTYYQYATFSTSNSVFKGGYDVDGYDDLLYVNRQAAYLDVYRITLLDTDGDGKLEPNQHPSNPQDLGPMEQRTLTFVKTYTNATDNAPMGTASQAEVFAQSDRIFSLGPTRNGDITQYVLATKATTVVADSLASIALSQMGFGDQDGVWYGSNESNRRVYSFCPSSRVWVMEFNYPNLAGTHMDGLEVIVAPATGVQYVYVSDMTSDFIAQYRRAGTAWTQVNVFRYNDATSSSVEGMGFGPLRHFWATGGSYLYEIGGGDLTGYLQ